MKRWLQLLKSVGDKEIARGMVDESNFTHLVVNGDSVLVDDIEGKDGKLISLTTDQAVKYGIADGSFSY